MSFYENNKELCFLIKLDDENKNMTASQIAVYQNGDIETLDFYPPEKLLIKNIKDDSRGFDSYNITVTWEKANHFVKGCAVQIFRSENFKTRMQEFFVKESSTEAKINLKGLQPNTTYTLKFSLVTNYGRGPDR